MARFDYDLPPDAIAQRPSEPRDRARLLVDGAGGIQHLTVSDLPRLVGTGDVVVVNESKVLPARLLLHRPTGGRTEILLLEPAGGGRWEALVRPGRKVPPGTTLIDAAGMPVVEVGEHLPAGRRLATLIGDDDEVMQGHGSLPLPPYISAPLPDESRYQTVYAAAPGSVAAPTAGLHLTERVLAGVRANGAQVCTVDLCVGLDTFRPISVDDPADHQIHSERYRVPDATLEACELADRVIAVGTTTVRALETAARGDREGRTSLFIRRPFDFAVVDLLLTNFHLPRSSLLLLVDAFVGDRWRDLYAAALADGYRFLSFGDAMLIGRAGLPGAGLPRRAGVA
jgi:S-adenosylmethionine:tRNA ribosyltransferase-isomerase